MIQKSIEVNGSGDGKFVWWDSGPCEKTCMASALDAAGLKSGFLNRDTSIQSLTTTMESLITNLKIKVFNQPIKLFPLAKPRRGLEAVRVVKGQAQNEHRFLFSCEISDGVKFVEYDPDNLPEGFHSMINNYERAMSAYYAACEQEFSVEHTSQILSDAFTSSLGAVRPKSGSAFFFVPPASLTKVQALSDALETNEAESDSGGKLAIASLAVELADNPSVYKSVMSSFSRHIKDELARIQDELAKLSKSPKSSGTKRRLDEITSMEKQIEEYSQLLQVPMDDLVRLTSETRDAINTVAALSYT